MDFSAQITQLSVLGILPLDRFEVYLRLGAGFWDGESVQRLDQSFGTDVVNRSISDSGTGFLGGVVMGSVAQRVVQLASMPVVLVK